MVTSQSRQLYPTSLAPGIASAAQTTTASSWTHGAGQFSLAGVRIWSRERETQICKKTIKKRIPTRLPFVYLINRTTITKTLTI